MRAPVCFVLLWCCVLLSAGPAFAQDASPQVERPAPPDSSIVTTPPAQVVQQPYYVTPPERELEEAERRSRAVRNALIGTSVGFGVGIILVGVGASQCDQVNRFDGSDEWVCNDAGDVLLGLGGTFIGLGTIGMITTGIMLGVRNKQKREIERDLRNRYGGRFRWDPSSGRFVF